MKRGLLLVASVLLAVLLGSAPAIAAKPEIVEDVRFDPTVTEVDPFLSEACGFTVTVSATGHFRMTVYRNADGSTRREVGHPSYRSTFSSEWGAITTDDRGVDKFTENPDGTLSIFGTGIHFRVKGEAYAIGLWQLLIDPDTGELLDASYHGNFGLEAPDIGSFICARLGPPPGG
jgi:hypothetical protein